jgi:hypothetical protein
MFEEVILLMILVLLSIKAFNNYFFKCFLIHPFARCLLTKKIHCYFRMAARAIREVQGLNIVYKHIKDDKSENGGVEAIKYFAVENSEDLAEAEANHPWILTEVSSKNVKMS